MYTVSVEKEIKHENKVLAGLTLRQLICVLTGAGLCLAVWLLTGLGLDAMVVPWASIGVICGAAGWVKRDNMYLEDYLLRWMERLVYRNGILTYKTANSYVRLYNRGRADEEQQREKTRAYRAKKKKKQKERKRYRSKLKGYE